MTSIRSTKKALKREIQRLESETDYSVFRANDATLQERASTWTNAWLVAFKESELASLIVRCRVKSFHTKMMRKFKAMHEGPKKEELRQKTEKYTVEIWKRKLNEPSAATKSS